MVYSKEIPLSVYVFDQSRGALLGPVEINLAAGYVIRKLFKALTIGYVVGIEAFRAFVSATLGCALVADCGLCSWLYLLQNKARGGLPPVSATPDTLEHCCWNFCMN